MRFCEECGAKLDDDAKFCEECGTAVEQNVLNEGAETVISSADKEETIVVRFCEECGAKLEADAKFCEECGAVVEEFAEAVETVSDEQEVLSEMVQEEVISVRFCEECGAKLEAGAKFCEECGAAIEELVVEEPQEEIFEETSEESAEETVEEAAEELPEEENVWDESAEEDPDSVAEEPDSLVLAGEEHAEEPEVAFAEPEIIPEEVPVEIPEEISEEILEEEVREEAEEAVVDELVEEEPQEEIFEETLEESAEETVEEAAEELPEEENVWDESAEEDPDSVAEEPDMLVLAGEEHAEEPEVAFAEPEIIPEEVSEEILEEEVREEAEEAVQEELVVEEPQEEIFEETSEESAEETVEEAAEELPEEENVLGEPAEEKPDSVSEESDTFVLVSEEHVEEPEVALAEPEIIPEEVPVEISEEEVVEEVREEAEEAVVDELVEEEPQEEIFEETVEETEEEAAEELPEEENVWGESAEEDPDSVAEDEDTFVLVSEEYVEEPEVALAEPEIIPEVVPEEILEEEVREEAEEAVQEELVVEEPQEEIFEETSEESAEETVEEATEELPEEENVWKEPAEEEPDSDAEDEDTLVLADEEPSEEAVPMSVCAKCGAKLPIGMKFCGECGAPLEVAAESDKAAITLEDMHPKAVEESPEKISEKSEPKTQNKSKAGWIILAGILLIAIVLFVLFGSGILQQNGKQQEVNNGDNLGVNETVAPTMTAAPTETIAPTATPKLTATEAPKPTATATPKPTVTVAPTEAPKPTATATPKPTATEAPTATPTPTSTPTPAPTPTLTPEQVEYYRTTAPEWRDIATDSDAIKGMKQNLRNNGHCKYWFKDRMDGIDCWIQENFLSVPENEVLAVKLYSYQTESEIVVDKEFYDIIGNVVKISEEYMDSLMDGYYDIITWCIDAGNGSQTGLVQSCYVAESDPYQADASQWLQNTTQEYKDGAECVSAVVTPNSTKVISGLSWSYNRTTVNEALYEISPDGKVLRLSVDLLQLSRMLGRSSFIIHSADGCEENLKVYFPALTEIPTLSSIAEKEYSRVTAPEWRELASDSEADKRAKQEIREHNFPMVYWFKDRIDGNDFVGHLMMLRNPECSVTSADLYSYREGTQKVIDESYYDVNGDVIRISEKYMDSLANGYYRLQINYLDASQQAYSTGWWLYVAQDDVYQEPSEWVFYSSYICDDENDFVSVVVKPDSTKKFSHLEWVDGPVDEALYDILYDGRCLRFSSELLSGFTRSAVFDVYSTDGSKISFRIQKGSY